MSNLRLCTKMNSPHWEEKNGDLFLRNCSWFCFFQLEVQSCCVFLPNDSLPSPSTIVSGDIPGTVRSWYHGQTSMPGTLVVCLPQIKIMSAGHKHMEPLQEIPFVVLRPILEEGSMITQKHLLFNFQFLLLWKLSSLWKLLVLCYFFNIMYYWWLEILMTGFGPQR